MSTCLDRAMGAMEAHAMDPDDYVIGMRCDELRALRAEIERLKSPIKSGGDLGEWLKRQPDDDGVAAGGGVLPSCLCCGQVGKPKVWKIDDPTTYVCERCKAASEGPDSGSGSDAEVLARREGVREGVAMAQNLLWSTPCTATDPLEQSGRDRLRAAISERLRDLNDSLAKQQSERNS